MKEHFLRCFETAVAVVIPTSDALEFSILDARLVGFMLIVLSIGFVDWFKD